MNLNADDIKMLAMFAYNRTLMRQYGDALLVYRFLAAMEPDELRWQLGAGTCLVHGGAYEEADLWLQRASNKKLAQEQNDLLTRLFRYVAHYKEKSAKEKTPQKEPQKKKMDA